MMLNQMDMPISNKTVFFLHIRPTSFSLPQQYFSGHDHVFLFTFFVQLDFDDRKNERLDIERLDPRQRFIIHVFYYF